MEFATANTRARCWICVRGEVWDVTGYLDKLHHSPTILSRILGPQAFVGKLAQAATKFTNDDNWFSLADIEEEARGKLAKNDYNYFSTGAEDEMTLRANQVQFRKYAWFVPRTILTNSPSPVDLRTRVFGHEFSAPLMLCATAMQQLADPYQAELGPLNAAMRKNVCYMAPHLSSRNWEELASVFPRFLQLYLPQDDVELDTLLKRAEALDFKALFVTVDSAKVGKRERDLRSRGTATSPRASGSNTASRWKTSFSLADLRDLRRRTSLPIVLKGVQRGDDAVLAVRAFDLKEFEHCGIMVSNHGARNLDGARPSLASLVEVHSALCRAGLRKRVTLFFDGGVRRGGDVIKALCLGANVVGVGRPMIYALAARGQTGVERMIDILLDEARTTMSLLGCSNIDELAPNLVEYPRGYL